MQNDVYGSVVLAAAQMFVDERLPQMGDESLFRMLEELGAKALAAAFEPDAGLWEYRTARGPTPIRRPCAGPPATGWRRSADGLGLAERAEYWKTHAFDLREKILAEAWDERQGALTGAFGEPALDAAVLLVAKLGLLRRPTPRSSGLAKRSAGR